MILAQAAAQDVAGGAAVATCIMAVIASLFSWLTARDKYRFDATAAEMKTEIASLRKETQDCHEAHEKARHERDLARKERDALHEEVRVLRARMDSRSAERPATKETP